MTNRPNLLRLLLALACLGVASCGSSGGETGNQVQNQGNSNWDQLIWDQDNWA